MSKLSTVPGVSCNAPDSTFYAFVDWRSLVGRAAPSGERVTDDEALCNYLLRDFGVAVVPGSAFGTPGFLRISFASAEGALSEGMFRIRNGFASLAG